MHPRDPRLILGRTNWRDLRKVVGLNQADRLHHLYVIGQTGTGKSTLLENLMRQDLEACRGFAFLDPHGDAVAQLANSVTDRHSAGLVYVDAPDATSEVGFNPIEAVPPAQRSLAASGIIEAFKNVWDRWWGPRLEHLFRNALLTLLDQPTATLAEVLRLFADDRYRKECVTRVTHPAVRDFWIQEFEKYPIRYRAEMLAPLRNKLGAFLSQPSLHRILTKERSSFDLREVMDSGKVLLVNLSKGQMGADASSLLGALLVTRISLAALSRAHVPESERRPFFVYLDEFQNFTTLSVAGMLSELRKYRIGMVLAHQYLDQLAPEVREAILGNAGTLVSFRLGPTDVRIIGKYLDPVFTEYDLLHLPNHSVYLRLMVDGMIVRPFSADTLPPYA
ncbi:MAG: type IV secretory system conjugative DNA transfer family protein [Planctomycetota bacterium]